MFKVTKLSVPYKLLKQGQKNQSNFYEGKSFYWGFGKKWKFQFSQLFLGFLIIFVKFTLKPLIFSNFRVLYMGKLPSSHRYLVLIKSSTRIKLQTKKSWLELLWVPFYYIMWDSYNLKIFICNIERFDRKNET